MEKIIKDRASIKGGIMNPWVWRIIIIVLAIAFVPMIVAGTAALITAGIHEAGQNIHSIFEVLFKPGDARLEVLIRLCLYLIVITLLFKALTGIR
jgi:hypothetical protein